MSAFNVFAISKFIFYFHSHMFNILKKISKNLDILQNKCINFVNEHKGIETKALPPATTNACKSTIPFTSYYRIRYLNLAHISLDRCHMITYISVIFITLDPFFPFFLCKNCFQSKYLCTYYDCNFTGTILYSHVCEWHFRSWSKGFRV